MICFNFSFNFFSKYFKTRSYTFRLLINPYISRPLNLINTLTVYISLLLSSLLFGLRRNGTAACRCCARRHHRQRNISRAGHALGLGTPCVSSHPETIIPFPALQYIRTQPNDGENLQRVFFTNCVKDPPVTVGSLSLSLVLYICLSLFLIDYVIY